MNPLTNCSDDGRLQPIQHGSGAVVDLVITTDENREEIVLDSKINTKEIMSNDRLSMSANADEPTTVSNITSTSITTVGMEPSSMYHNQSQPFAVSVQLHPDMMTSNQVVVNVAPTAGAGTDSGLTYKHQIKAHGVAVMHSTSRRKDVNIPIRNSVNKPTTASTITSTSTTTIDNEPSSIYQNQSQPFAVHPDMMTSNQGAVNVGPTEDAGMESGLTYKHQVKEHGVAVHSTRRPKDVNIPSRNSVNNNINNTSPEYEQDIIAISLKPGAINVAPNNRSNDNTDIPVVDGSYNGYIDSNNTMMNESEIIMEGDRYVTDIPLAAEVYEENNVPLAHASVLHQFSFKKKVITFTGISVLIITIIMTITFSTAKNREATSSMSSFDESRTPSPTNTDSPSIAPTMAYHVGTDHALFIAVDKFLSGGINQSQVVSKYGSIEYWDVTNIHNFSTLFSSERNRYAANFSEDISRWDVSDAITFSYMFDGATKFNASLALWNVSNTVDMEGMFRNARSFLGNGIDRWETRKVSNTMYMFQHAVKFDANLSGWDVSGLVNMEHMFGFASLYRGVGIEEWNTSRVEKMQFTFSYALRFNANLSKWDISSTKSLKSMFYDSPNFQGIGIDVWNTSNVEDMAEMFFFVELFDANLSRWDVSKVKDMSYMFAHSSFKGVGVDVWDTGNAHSIYSMFEGLTDFDVNLTMWDTSNVRLASGLFSDSPSFRGIGLENWNTSKIESMSNMFADAVSFDANLSQWDVSNVRIMYSMFNDAKSFRGTGLEEWNVSNVNDTGNMFNNAILFDANLTGWDTSNIEDMDCMFTNATQFRGVSWMDEDKNCQSFDF